VVEEIMLKSKELVRFAVLALAATACGTHADTEGPPREEMNEELGRVREALGEATCATTPADATMQQGSGADSVTAFYDHPTCRNAFIVDAPGIVTAGVPGKLQFWAGVSLGALEPFTCLFNYGGLTLFQKQGSSYVKVGENFVLGTFGVGRFGGMCSATGFVTVPGPGDYKVAAAAGTLFGGKYAVRVGNWTTQ
jgi:hypothetical protein